MLWTHAAAAVLALAAGFVGGWRVNAWKAGAELAESQRQAAAEAARRFEHAKASASGYEVAREAQRVRTITVTREVQREVLSDPDCSARALPDGLRRALADAAAGAGQPVSAGPLPAASAAPVGDVGGSGAGLRRPAGGTVGLQGASPGTG